MDKAGRIWQGSSGSAAGTGLDRAAILTNHFIATACFNANISKNPEYLADCQDWRICAKCVSFGLGEAEAFLSTACL